MSRRPQRAQPRPAAPQRPAPVEEFDEDYDVDSEELDDTVDDEYDDEDEPLDAVDADAFFAAELSAVRPAVLVLYGQEYVLPTRTPLSFSLLAERHATEESLSTFRKVLTPVFGEEALDDWLDRGIDERKLAIVLMFAAQNMDRPGSATLADCARRYAEQDARGKALNRAARRAGSGGRSSRTGRS